MSEPREAPGLTLYRYAGARRFVKLRLQVEVRDLWVGLFWRTTEPGPGMRALHIYLCLVPLLPLHLTIGRREP